MNTIFLSFSISNSSVTDFFLQLANKLAEENNVIIITDRLERKIEANSNIEVFKWPSVRPNKFKDFVFLCKLIKRFKPVLMVSIFGAVNMFTVAGFILNVKNRIAWCRTLSTQFKNSKMLELRKRMVYKLCTNVLVNSYAVKQDLINNFGVKNEKIHVIYNAVKTQNFQNKVEVESNKIVYAGRMHPSKGIDTLLKAMPKVLKEFPKLKLKIIGGNLNSSEFEKYLEMTLLLKIKDNIIFTGNQSKEVLLNEFSSAYFSIVPSITEAFGFVIIESFSVKTPVIGANNTGIAEVIRDKKDGFLFETQNENDLSEKMIFLLKQPALRNEFSANCYERFLEKFELEKNTNETANMLQSLI
ncbi:glycosyltransferase family 4 protein [Flavobacterium sp. 3-218]